MLWPLCGSESPRGAWEFDKALYRVYNRSAMFNLAFKSMCICEGGAELLLPGQGKD